MYFGDYLVEKKIITPSQLIEALAFQLENLPSMVRLIHEAGVINPAELLQLIKTQIKQDIDLFSVLIDQKKISREQASDLALKQWSRRMPLGEVLVKLSMVTRDQLDYHLDSYFEAKEKKSLVSVASAEPLINDAALESLRELGIDTSSLAEAAPKISAVEKAFKPKEEINHFLNVFNDKQKNKMLKLVSIIEETQNKQENVSNYINSLFRDLHLIKGAVFLSEINAIEAVTAEWDESLESVLNKGEESESKWCQTHLKNFRLFLELLWQIREKMAADQTDEGLDNNFTALSSFQMNRP